MILIEPRKKNPPKVWEATSAENNPWAFAKM